MITVSEEVDAPIERVWAIVGDFAGLKRWHPTVERCETEGSGEGTLRKVYFADWWATERLDRHDPAAYVIGYSVTDSSRPANVGVHGTIALAPAGAERTRVEWTAGVADDHPAKAQVEPMLAAYYPSRIADLRHALEA